MVLRVEWMGLQEGGHTVVISTAMYYISDILLGLATSAPQSQQNAQLSRRDGAAGCVIVFAKRRRLELGDNISPTL